MNIKHTGAYPRHVGHGGDIGVPTRMASKLPLWGTIGALMLLSSLFLGVLATTADLVMIGAGLGLLAGAFLLAAPRMVIWIMIGLSLTTGVLVSLAGPAYVRLPWALSLLSFILWPLALFKLLQLKRVPLFVWLALAFVGLCVAGSAFDWYSLDEFVAGFKRYFQAYGLLFALATLGFTTDDMRRWQKLILAIALLQLPVALYEFVVLVPLRGGLNAGSAALDVVAGTFGANLYGGSPNAEMSAFLLIVLAFLGMRWHAGLLATRSYLACTLICLIPLGLGETKIVVLLLPLTVFILLRRDFFKAPARYMPVILGFCAITALLGYIYVTLMMKSTLSAVLNNIVHYNFEQAGYGRAYLNRTTVLSFWWERHGWHDPLTLLFGHGIGSSYWSPTNLLAGHIGMQFARYSIDLTAVAALLWDVGLVGALLYFLVIGAAWHAANRLGRDSRDAVARVDALSIQAALAIVLVFLFYNSSAVNLLPFQVLIASLLGYLAFLYRTDPALAESDRPARHHSFQRP
ncbi:hypothetical protein [Noviherbaspirillum sedimenti]|uniref:O-antigen ligase n=1 Tax=Noviherbaspirillum sedimenti TaxID=2320865 RepID=A0A3A3FXY3_9BURK|nr:hypothetical protein [Noviherbaspirillum sedimenti]RJG01078.1 hypothetical protein D3878_05345 [Noviherbaspirillum sedimenti]